MQRGHRPGHIVTRRVLEVGTHHPVQRLVVDHVGGHVARGHGVDRHPEVGELEGHGLAQSDDPPLRGHIGGGAGIGRPAHHRGDGDDPPVTLPSHVPCRRPHGVEHPGQVDVDHLRPFGGGHRADGANGCHPGVGHQDVDRSEIGVYPVDEGDQGVEVADVDHRRAAPPALAGDLVDRLGHVALGCHGVADRGDVVADVADGDVCPQPG